LRHWDGGDRAEENPVGTALGYRRTAWDCLKLAEASSSPKTRAALLDLAQHWVRLAEEAERNGQYGSSEYQARAWQCAARAQTISDPERRADMLRFAGMWLSLTEPIQDPFRGAYELPPRKAA
jgi:hypothetical protein